MAHFARQKRQSRFYWAELGFLALGLLGLQPSLFTNLMSGSQSKSSSHHQAFQNQEFTQNPAFDIYRDWTNTHLSSYMPTQQISYPQSAHLAGQFAQPSTYAQSQQQLYAQLPAYAGTGSNPYHQSYAPQSANYHPQPLYTQSIQQAVPSGWQNQAAYPAEASNGYPNPNASAYGNWLPSQPTTYGSNTGSYQPNAAYQPYSNIGTNAYSGLTPRLSQQPLFESGYNSNYRTGTASTALSAQSYPFPSNTTNSGAWRPYRPATSIYR